MKEKLSYHTEHFEKLQNLIERNLEALQQAHLTNPEVRKKIGQVIVSQFKNYLKLY